MLDITTSFLLDHGPVYMPIMHEQSYQLTIKRRYSTIVAVFFLKKIE